MKKQIPLMVFIAAAGIFIGLWLQPSGTETRGDNGEPIATPVSLSDSSSKSQPMATANADELNPEIYELSALRELVQHEVQARKQLQAELDEVNARLEYLENSPPAGMANTRPESDATIVRSTNNRRSEADRPGWINSQALLDAGVDEFQAGKIRDVYEQVEMEKLYLRDRAIREGWIGDDRYRKEREQLDARLDSLRGELSETEYDAYLFATGRPNRVIIQNTLSTSPARDAGVKPGDSVIRYNNIRVFTWADLRNATTQCPAATMVELEMERDGRRNKIYVPCGPLGVKLDNTSMQPQP